MREKLGSLDSWRAGAGELVRTERNSPTQPFAGKVIYTGPSAGFGAGKRDAFYSPSLAGALSVGNAVVSTTGDKLFDVARNWSAPTLLPSVRL